MSVDSGGYSPSAEKPAQAIADWTQRDMDIELVEFEPATIDDLALAHSRKFAQDVLSGERRNGHGNTTKEVTESCLKTVGSLIAACRAAFTERIVCSPTSGFHHAGYKYNGAFCTFNGLIVAARKMIAEGRCSKVAILDCDAHYGDGTDNCIDTLKLKDQIKHWTFGEHYHGADFDQSQFVSQVQKFLRDAVASGVQLLIYQAGADPHVNDPLGGTMTTKQMRQRDRVVFAECVKLGLPVAWVFAGGYQRDESGRIAPVLNLHRATAEEAIAALKTIAQHA